MLPGDGTQELTVLPGDAELFACQCNMKCCALPATAGTLTAAQHGDAPFFIITCRNFTTTLELGRISTWRLPRFSALYMLLRASPSTLIRTMLRRRLKRAGAARLAAAVASAFPLTLAARGLATRLCPHVALLGDLLRNCSCSNLPSVPLLCSVLLSALLLRGLQRQVFFCAEGDLMLLGVASRGTPPRGQTPP